MALEVDAGGIERLSRLADYLATGRQGQLELEAFLLSLLSLVRRAVPPSPAAVPAWLSRAMDRFARGAELSGGPAELAQLAGRSSEHVNRTMRRLFGRTTTEYIHEVRLNRAGRLLRLTAQPIAEIALDCGYDNLGYFYRRFGERFGLTPRAYRMTNG
jgi:AraC family cel operon transcriptional repressor